MNLCLQDFVVFEVCHLAVETNHPKQHCSTDSLRPLYILISVCKERKGLTRLSASTLEATFFEIAYMWSFKDSSMFSP